MPRTTPEVKDPTKKTPTAPSTKRQIFTGGCLCGQVRFEAVGPAQRPHTCSCKMCQRHSGAFTVSWVEFAREDVTWTGPGGPPSVYRSSPASSRAFCPTCGSTLGAIDDNPVVALTLGAFDPPISRALIPTGHSYRAARPKWWHVDIGAP